jgi:CubicO group peptidase (beta-lactamase class C family)
MRPILAATLSLALALPALAQDRRLKPPPSTLTPRAPISSDPGVRDISSLLSPIIREHKVPAMAVAIVQGWKTTHLGVAGVRKSGEKDKVTVEDKWHLGSDTKAMTATLCGVLVEENKLRWNQTLAETFPDLAPHPEKMNPAWKPVTLEQLLTNRAGAPANLDRDGLWQSLWNFKGTPTESRRALLEGVLKHPPEHEPGSKFLYSNAGFAIAGHMAEKVTGTSWEELMTRKVFDPLQMFSAGFGPPGTKAGKPVKRDDIDAPPGGYKPESGITQPRGHRSNGSPVEPGPNADNPVAIGPAGIVHCTIGDWAKFIALHLRGDPSIAGGGDYKLLRADTMKKLHTEGADTDGKPDGTYAMGWGITTRAWAGAPGSPGRVLTHAGSNTMWYCVTWIAPEKDLAILITCNQGGDAAVKACDQAAQMLIREATKDAK